MVITRSANKQMRIEDFSEDKAAAPKVQQSKTKKPPKAEKQSKISTSKDGGMLSPPPSPTKKRKTPPQAASKGSNEKKAKTEDEPIMINRAPVLHLWAATVTQFLYPKLDWSTCLSAGSAVSAICAVAKGRAVGAIDEPEDTEEKRKKKDERKAEEEEYPVLEVMQFKLKHKDGKVYFGGKPQSNQEETLRKKYGDRYEDVKGAFEEALGEWKGEEEELSKAAFGMYEDFRPTVAAGHKGWGRKGALDLGVVRKTIQRS